MIAHYDARYYTQLHGVWRSRLARSVWDAEAGGSSPLTPTILMAERDRKMSSKTVELFVQEKNIELSSFVQLYFKNLIKAILTTLDCTVKHGNVIIESGQPALSLCVDDVPVNLNPFVSKMVYNTLKGMILSLHDIGSAEDYRILLKLE